MRSTYPLTEKFVTFVINSMRSVGQSVPLFTERNNRFPPIYTVPFVWSVEWCLNANLKPALSASAILLFSIMKSPVTLKFEFVRTFTPLSIWLHSAALLAEKRKSPVIEAVLFSVSKNHAPLAPVPASPTLNVTLCALKLW